MLTTPHFKKHIVTKYSYIKPWTLTDTLVGPKQRKRDVSKDGYSGSRMWGYGLDRPGSGYGQVAGTCACCNEPSGSIKCEEFIDWLKTC